MASVFTRIINREIPGYIVAESDNFIAFLDITPIAKGHCLVIPKKEVDYIFDIDDDNYMQLFQFAKLVADKIKKAMPCIKVGMAVIGLEVPHAHIHLVPMNNIGDLSFSGKRLNLSELEFIEIQNKILNA
ncbi:MAG: HIT family protein [Bacteroidota bacterium]|jgi:histidine triad (HIT) family protein